MGVASAALVTAAQYHLGKGNLERQRWLGKVLNPFTRTFVTQAGLPAAARCLDVGCGIGETTRLLASVAPNAECVGLQKGCRAACGGPATER